MIIDCVRGDIIEAETRIVFAIDDDVTIGGFAGMVAERWWHGLGQLSRIELGSYAMATCKRLSTDGDDGAMDFYALSCHQHRPGGWEDAPAHIERALNSIHAGLVSDPTAGKPALGVVLMGGGPAGQMAQADVFANFGGMSRSEALCRVYRL